LRASACCPTPGSPATNATALRVGAASSGKSRARIERRPRHAEKPSRAAGSYRWQNAGPRVACGCACVYGCTCESVQAAGVCVCVRTRPTTESEGSRGRPARKPSKTQHARRLRAARALMSWLQTGRFLQSVLKPPAGPAALVGPDRHAQGLTANLASRPVPDGISASLGVEGAIPDDASGAAGRLHTAQRPDCSHPRGWGSCAG
jgi:hypothetical protein